MTKLTLRWARLRADPGPGGPTISSSKQIGLVLAVLGSGRGGESRAKQKAFVSVVTTDAITGLPMCKVAYGRVQKMQPTC